MHRTPKVNEVNEFIEIASDFEDPLEVIREALSNSYDAMATRVDIGIKQDKNGRNTLVIEDNGHGMDPSDLESFFDLGNSNKEDGIGYKGHGTKIYYKSDEIRVESIKDGTRVQSLMERPWEKLNQRKLPTYSVETEATSDPSGTCIEVEGFRAGLGFDPQRLTYNKIEHYIKWKTIGGSTAWHFEDDFHDMEINVKLSPRIDDTKNQLSTTNKLEFPEENRDPDGEFVGEIMCKHYPKRELEVRVNEEQTVTLQIVGMIGGKKVRNKLPTYGKHSAQFGVWLAKEHIKVERINDTIGSDNQYFHFFFIVNCQQLELSSNREKIRNKSGDVYQAIEDELNHFMEKVCQDSWYRSYLERRRLEDKKRSVRKQQETLEERLQRFEEGNGFTPSNSAEVVAALERYSANGAPETVRIADFRMNDDVNAIVETDNGYDKATLLVKLSDFFEEKTPISNIDRFICWKIGDRDALSRVERSSYYGEPIRFDLRNGQVRYGENKDQTIPILQLDEKLSS